MRGIAAFLVFFHHFLLAFYGASYGPSAIHLYGWEVRYGKSVFSFLSNGNFCVCVFFVLSGFVLSRKYFEVNKISTLVSGAQRRFVRLYIPVAATLTLAYILTHFHLFNNVPVSKIAGTEWWFAGMWDIPHTFRKYWECLTYSTMFYGDSTFDTSMWTISTELYGSLFVFAFLALTHNTRNRLFMLALVFAYCKVTNQEYFASFTFGIALNYVERSPFAGQKLRPALVAIALLVVGLVLGSYPSTIDISGTMYMHVPQFIMDYAYWFHTVGACFVVLAFVLFPPFQRAVSIRPFRFLGYISFCFYLLHPVVMGCFSCFAFLQLFGRFGYNVSVSIVFVLTMAVLFLMSWLMTRYIDAPGIQLAKYLYERWGMEKPETEAAR